MKSALSVFLLFVLTSFQENTPVKSQIKWTCDSRWKKIKKEEAREFDSNDNLVRWIQYTESFNICTAFKYEYEGKKIMKEVRTNCDSNFGTTTTYKYGANGRLEQQTTWEGKKISKISKFKFKSPTDKYPYVREDSDNETEPYSINNLKYDKTGNLLEEEQLVPDSWFGTYTFKFNAKGQLIYETASVDGGVGLVETFYIYEKDVLVKDSVKIPDSPTEFHIYEIKKL